MASKMTKILIRSQAEMDILGKKWYYRMLRSSPGKGKVSNGKTLFDNYDESEMEGKLIVSIQIKIKNKMTRLFTLFDSYIDFNEYQKLFKEEDRCFYEVILGEYQQKPHFDLDMNLEDYPDGDIDAVIYDVIKSITKVMKDNNRILNLSKDVIICTSHGEKKSSCHIVIDNYCHQGNVDSKHFYERVMLNIKDKNKVFVDEAVYSRKQQFRICGSQKTGSGRPKAFRESWSHKKLNINNSFGNISKSIDKKLIILSKTLVSFTDCCSILPSLGHKNKKYETHELSREDEEGIIKTIVHNIPNFYSYFKIRNVNGSIISLQKTNISYMCIVCEREHDSENPYIISKKNGDVVYMCRRAKTGKLIHKENCHIENMAISIELLTESFDEDIKSKKSGANELICGSKESNEVKKYSNNPNESVLFDLLISSSNPKPQNQADERESKPAEVIRSDRTDESREMYQIFKGI